MITLTFCWQAKDQGRAVRPVVNFESGSLESLVAAINRCTSPTTFDLCGRDVSCMYEHSEDEFVITTRDTGIRNGRILLANGVPRGPCLAVSGAGFQMEGVTILWGHTGVRVEAGGVVTLWGCTLRGMGVGIDTVGPAAAEEPTLLAYDLKVLGCKACGIRVGVRSDIQLTDCLVEGCAGPDAIASMGDLKATRLRCVNNSGMGVQVGNYHHAETVLTDCTVTGNRRGGVNVSQGSMARLVGCMLDGVVPEADMETTVVVIGKVRSPCGLASPNICCSLYLDTEYGARYLV